MSAAAVPTQVNVPSDQALRNPAGPPFTLRIHKSNNLRARGSSYTTNDFPDTCTSVGHVYFHPGTRSPPVPPYAELQTFIAAHPNAPVVVNHDRQDGNSCEEPHILFARLDVNHINQVVMDADNVPVIHLFTVAADTYSRAFDPATHVKNGRQYEGVNVLDWSMCNFDKHYQAATLGDTYRKIYQMLRKGL